jgi:hypothetical protein
MGKAVVCDTLIYLQHPQNQLLLHYLKQLLVYADNNLLGKNINTIINSFLLRN